MFNLVNPYLKYLMPWREGWLLKQFVMRQLRLKYRGFVIGIGWSLLTPLFQLCIYVFVFKYALRLRWTGSNVSEFDFALLLFTGLTIFSLFSECVTISSILLLKEPNLIKKVRFPIEILNWATFISASVSFLISTALLLLACLISGIPISASWFALPLIFLPLVPLILGCSWFFSSTGVYVRDLKQILDVILPLLQFVSPIFYPVDALPPKLQPILFLNPLTLIIEQSRSAIFYGQWPDLISWTIEMTICSVIAIWGAIIHSRLSKGFADVI
ncbi:MAG: ABC transporter permease [Desulfobacterales bacterium]|nr:ABC transporter permease [Desulfobacterales bacterium]